MVSILLIMFDDDNCTIAGQISDKDLASKHQLSDRCDLPGHFERSVVSDCVSSLPPNRLSGHHDTSQFGRKKYDVCIFKE